jgi:hypothetical protein
MKNQAWLTLGFNLIQKEKFERNGYSIQRKLSFKRKSK